jgi:hypothetical protein
LVLLGKAVLKELEDREVNQVQQVNQEHVENQDFLVQQEPKVSQVSVVKGDHLDSLV